MPQITTQIPDIKATGALLQIFIFPPAHMWWKDGMNAEDVPIFTATGLIDTGASISAIDYGIATALKLISRDVIPIMTPSGVKDHYTYDVSLMLPESLGHKSFPVEVTGADLARQGIQVLIGRDVLKHCSFVYNGVDNTWHLAI